MTSKHIQAFIDALVEDHKKADIQIQAEIEICARDNRPASDSREERARYYAKMQGIRDVLIHMDFHLPGSKRMVRRALEKIDPNFAVGYYGKRKKEVCDGN